MPHGTSGPSPGERLVAGARNYVVFGVLSVVGYGGVVIVLGRFPEPLLLGILVASALKDVYDEYRLRRGDGPLAYAGIEHSPSNAVLIAFVLTGVIRPTGTVLGVSVGTLALWLAAADLVFDLSQDARA